jgi:hypothetical protein
MFDAPMDVPPVWVALALASAVFAGVAADLTLVAPDATAAAGTVDRVAAAEHAATAEHPLPAEELRLSPRSIALRSPGGVAHARFRFGPVAVVVDGPLRAVLRGAPPERAFDSRRAFARAVERAEDRSTDWRPTDGPLVVRRVSWGDVDATLVG